LASRWFLLMVLFSGIVSSLNRSCSEVWWFR
jgi:hypothetical protein